MIIAIDIGYGYTKATDGINTIVFPSVIGIAENIKYKGNLAGKADTDVKGIHLHTSQGERFVGNLALSQSRVNWNARDRQRTQADTLTLLYAALSELGAKGNITLVTGLPVKWYAQDKASLTQTLSGSHTITRQGYAPQTVTIAPLVTIQPFGSLFYLLFNESGKLINPELGQGEVGVIDIGTYTSDFIVSQQGQYIEPASGSTTTALSKIYELVGSEIESQFDHKMSLHQIGQAIQSGFIKIRGNKHSLHPIVEPILSGVAADILADISTTWADYESGLDTILVSGGGADLIGPYLIDRFPHLQILPEGHLTNVYGYHRYGLAKSKSAPKRKKQLNGAHANV